MADYFEEMGWEPVALDQTQRHQTMLMVRALLDHGFFPDEMLQGGRLAPPASKEVVRNLQERMPTPEDESCAICLKPNSDHPDIFKVLPCSHEFHQACILPWLNQTNSCPLCRYELKTDDAEYEERKKFLQRQKEREEELEGLHNSMFG
ncbi:E3 ubiquitin-protein ligase RNF181 [Phlebotomus argentipes]|uniref:E3 ubiquitin-protein ligase RNF181 n=1 Tax=Phlebotomus argentipes TaxID=94469 RepID=UPI0028931F2F|nr:E3 ubiquitin-protein ligase RNF181 [Phlebotomus argentipes]